MLYNELDYLSDLRFFSVFGVILLSLLTLQNLLLLLHNVSSLLEVFFSTLYLEYSRTFSFKFLVTTQQLVLSFIIVVKIMLRCIENMQCK